jgi:hypothetical protein
MNRCFFLFAVLLTLILAVFPFTACHDDDSDSTSLGQTDDDDHALIDDDDDDDDSGGGDDDDDDDNDDDDDDDNNNDNNDNNDDDNNDDNDTISFEYGIKTYSYTSVLPYLPNFAARGLHLYLGAGIGSIGTPELLAVLTQAEELGIDITLCPYPSSGSFANEETSIFTKPTFIRFWIGPKRSPAPSRPFPSTWNWGLPGTSNSRKPGPTAISPCSSNWPL